MARLVAGPEIYHPSIRICRLREQVNHVSHELIWVAWIQGTSLALAKRAWSPSTSQARRVLYFVTPFSSCSPHILFVFLSGVSFTAPAEQLPSCRRANIADEFWWKACHYLAWAWSAHAALLQQLLIGYFVWDFFSTTYTSPTLVN